MTNSDDKEWWYDDKYSRMEEGDCGCDGTWRTIYDLPKIVAEAERRTWEEARDMLQKQKITLDHTREGRVALVELQILESKIDAKLSCLSNSSKDKV